jgi:hypothetical protein
MIAPQLSGPAEELRGAEREKVQSKAKNEQWNNG